MSTPADPSNPSDEIHEPSKDRAQRRRFIREQLEMCGVLTLEDLRKAFPDAKMPSINADVEQIKRGGMQVEFENQVMRYEGFRRTTKSSRETQLQSAKQAIGRLTGGLIWGVHEQYQSESPATRMAGLSTREEILSKLEGYAKLKRGPKSDDESSSWENRDPDSEARAHRLKRLLIEDYWSKAQRVVALDAGTTTEAVAESISRIPLPCREHLLTHLTIFTNSRAIFTNIGRPECYIKTIIIGGEQRLNTEAISGHFAQRCLEAWNVKFGVAIVGAVTIDCRDWMLGCDNDNESYLKTALLTKSSIRVIVADHTKFVDHPAESMGWFGPIQDMVDLVITDEITGELESRFPVPVIKAGQIKG